MAEFVQQSIEEMLPELEQMERVGLFTTSETRQILKKRKNFEYKLRRKTKCKEDFIHYIQYEIHVLSLVKKRRQRIGYSFKKLEIDIAVVQRIHKLFRLATNRFQDDVKLWISHIEFSQKRKEKSTVSRLFTRMLQVHNRKPDLWILAAKWEFEDNMNPENARNLLQRGLRFNPSSKELWLEYYRMELLYTEKLRKRREILGAANITPTEDELPDAILKGLIAEVVYKKALEAFPNDVDFLLSFLPVCHLFDFAAEHEERIFEDLQKVYPNEPRTWDAVARKHLHKNANETVSDKDILKFYSVFEEAVKKISGGEIWRLYILGCLELVNGKCSNKQKDQRIRKLLEVFQQAYNKNKNYVTPELYVHWLDVLTNVGLIDRALQVTDLATAQYPKSLLPWKHKLQIMVRGSSSDSDVIKVFQEALKHLAEKESVCLWTLVMEYCSCSTSDEFKGLLERGLTSGPEVSCPVKEFYLQWTYLNSDIHQTRHLYKRLTQMKPVTKQFYQHYITMEMAQPKTKIKLLRKVFEDAVREFGSKDSDIWIDYIKFELNTPKGKPEEVGNIHFRAVKNLNGELNQRFIAQYTLLQTGIVQS